MVLLSAKEIRERYIKFFTEKKNHQYVCSSSVIPADDPTLLFANAGMNQFKPIFLGTVDPSSDMAKWTRAVNTQKCIRAGGKHNDLDDVGKDVYHHTFFEMLGNWSFGDYFKTEICQWAWQCLTEEFGLSADRLYVTYFGGDAVAGLGPDVECKRIWLELGLPDNHIIAGSMKDNFWEMGETGPCGPCSEIHYDRVGGGRSAAHLVNQDDPDVLEIWNLVFMQYNREKDGALRDLPKRHIDCGMGFERLVSVVQDARSNYDTDVFRPLFDAIERGTNAPPYGGKVGTDDVDHKDMAYRVLADHARTLTVALADGGRPDNVGRGYVLRRVLRRAVRYATEKLNAKPGFFATLVPVVVDLLGDTFPEVTKDPRRTMEIIDEEEWQFLRTLSRGRNLLNRTIPRLTGTVLPGDVAWRLYDTYGFPVDLTQLMVEERGLTVDADGYERARRAAQLISQNKAAGAEETVCLDVHALAELQAKGVPSTDDSPKYGYRAVPDGPDAAAAVYTFDDCVAATVLCIRTAAGEWVDRANAPRLCGVVLDKTCFYAEQGGQVADQGSAVKISVGGGEDDDETEFYVKDVQVRAGYVLHVGVVESGVLCVGDRLTLRIDGRRRRSVMNNHTATHVLNHALRVVLGDGTQQKGSLVAPDRLRFDFANKSAMTADQVAHVERLVNDTIDRDDPVYAAVHPLADARRVRGLRAMFDETYPDPVRVVSVGAPVDQLLADPDGPAGERASVEFCGGTHVHRTGHMQRFAVLVEEAVAKGVRRMVAVTGSEAVRACDRADEIRAQVTRLDPDDSDLSRAVADAQDRIAKSAIPYGAKDELRAALSALKKRVADADRKRLAAVAAGIADAVKERLADAATDDGPAVLVYKLDPAVGGNTRAIDTALKQVKTARPELAVMLVSEDRVAGRVHCHCAVTKGLNGKGLRADQWVSEVAASMDGKGGGKADSAQASGTNSCATVDDLVNIAKQFAATSIGGP